MNQPAEPSTDRVGSSYAERAVTPARLIALYLPQYFPIPENDAWWGPGFTEWTNVAKAKPLFPGHAQPKLPADLGFYDLRVPETRRRQAELARGCGIEGFCYWHYWFGNGRRILERPFEEVLGSGEPDFPFCLAWANQSWTGIWHGSPRTVLVEQTYPGLEDEIAHFQWALKAFRDPRYMRVDGKPIFAIFAPHDLPSTEAFIGHWRRLAEQNGLPGIYFVAISNIYKPGVNRYHGPILAPFDAVTPLTPQDYLETANLRAVKKKSFGQRVRRALARRIKERDFRLRLPREPWQIDYADVVAHALEDLPDATRFLPSVLPNWDNTPRSGVRGVVYQGATPELFRRYLDKAIEKVQNRPPEQAIIFIKAWNEWAEGNYLEPDATYGHARMDVVRSALKAGLDGPARPAREP